MVLNFLAASAYIPVASFFLVLRKMGKTGTILSVFLDVLLSVSFGKVVLTVMGYVMFFKALVSYIYPRLSVNGNKIQ